MNENSSLIASLSARFQKARFLSVSLVLHLVLGITVGGVVLFKAAQSPDGFVMGKEGSFLAESEEVGAPEPLPETIEFEENTATAASASAQVMEASAIQTLTSNSSFRMSASSAVLTMGSTISGSLATTLAGKPGIQSAPAKVGNSGFFGVPDAGAKGLSGTFYDLKQNDNGKPTNITAEEYAEVVAGFVKTWNASRLNKFFQAPTTLISSQIFTPDMDAKVAPQAFGVDKRVQPSLWVAWYRARVSPPKSGTYHFVGAGDDVMFVKFNGKMVLDRCWSIRTDEVKAVENYSYDFSHIHGGFAKGPAFRVEKGQFYDIDILIGEQPGVRFFASLLIEEQGVRYKKDGNGNPILPIFRVSDEVPSTDGDAKFPPFMKNGPVWDVQPPKR